MGSQQGRTQSEMSDRYTQGVRLAWNSEEVAKKMGEETRFLQPPMALRKSVYHGCKTQFLDYSWPIYYETVKASVLLQGIQSSSAVS